MTAERDAAASTEHSGDTLRVHLGTELDLAACGAADIDRLIPGGHTRHVRADARDVAFLDSAGISFLLRLRQRADSLGMTFELVNVPGTSRRALTHSGLAEYFGLDPAGDADVSE
jgi:anti-anti-sigma factor